jgi:hypothetical protein
MFNYIKIFKENFQNRERVFPDSVLEWAFLFKFNTFIYI